MKRSPYRRLVPRMSRSIPPVAMGSVGYGAGGPVWLDDFRSKRAPSPSELVNAYKGIAYACVSLNMHGVSRVPLRLFATTNARQSRPRCHARRVGRRQDAYLRGLRYGPTAVVGDAEVDEVMEHPFLEALRHPCPLWDGPMLVAYMVACLDVVGSAYLYPVRPDPTFAASEWWPLLAQYVFPVRGAGPEPLDHYQFFSETYRPDELVRFRRLSLRDPYLSGYAPLHAAFEQAGLVNYYTATVEDLLKNGARPAGAWVPSDPKLPPGEPERKRFQVDVNAQNRGGSQGRMLVTNGAFRWEPFQFSPVDLGALEITKSQRLLIANCFDVPISLLQTEDSNRAVAEAGNYQHQRCAVEPRCVAIAATLTAMAREVDPRLFFAFDCPVEADEEKRAKVFDIQAKAGKVTINEWREEDGQPPVDWGDEPWLPSTLVQPSTAEEQRQQSNKIAEMAAKNPPPPAPGDKPPGNTPAKGKDKADRKLARLARRTLERVNAALDDRERQAGRRGGDGPAPHAAGGGRQPLWAADRRADPAGGDPLVQPPDGGDPGDDPQGGDGAAGGDGLAVRGVGPADGRGDDADPEPLLAGVGREDDGPGGDRGGAGRVAGMDGQEPLPPGEDRGASLPVLPGDQPHDQAPVEPGPGTPEAGIDPGAGGPGGDAPGADEAGSGGVHGGEGIEGEADRLDGGE